MNNIFSPYQTSIPQYGGFNQFSIQPTQQTQLIKVNGIDGAKAFQMAPNSSVALFHESEDILYVKCTDGAGFPTIRTFRFTPYEEPVVEPVKYVTVEEFERFKQEVLDAK